MLSVHFNIATEDWWKERKKGVQRHGDGGRGYPEGKMLHVRVDQTYFES